MKLAYDVFSILILVAVTLTIAWLKQRLGVEGMRRVQEELNAKQELSLLAVKAVEQIWTGVLRGEEKADKASEIISEQATRIGLRIAQEEIKTLVEWAVRTLKDEFGNQWANATT